MTADKHQSSNITLKDQQYVWHPYSSLTNPIPAYEVISAEGVYMQLADGKQLIDGMSSWWCAIHGYNHPVLNTAAKDQIDRMSHVMFGGITHAPAVTLCEKLVEITPKGLNKVFLSDSGSVSVEVAIKMAFQYWISQGQSQKNKLLSLKGGYHGDTFAAMSVCDPTNGMHHIFDQVLPQHFFAPKPEIGFTQKWQHSDIAEFKSLLETHHKNIAAVILEPIVQGAGGMNFYSPEYLKQVRRLCTEHNVLLIADEIATGFGRTGKLFACEWANISPDIMCLGKSLTGGYMTLAATLCTDKVSHGICDGEAGCFMHGPTFMANPLACSAAIASIDLLLTSNWKKRVSEIETILRDQLMPLKSHQSILDVRILGAIGVLEFNEALDMKKTQEELIESGVWLRPYGKLLYTMPPFVISDEELLAITQAMANIVGDS